MAGFILKKLFYGILVLFGIIVIVFFLFNILPGDPARMMLGQRADVSSIEAINKDIGRDKPLSVQFFMYLNDISPISLHDFKNKENTFFLNPEKYDYIELWKISEEKILVLKEPYFRRSYQTKRKVTEMLTEAVPESAVLALTSVIFAAIIGISLGIVAAIKKNTFIDNVSIVVAVLGMSAPSFFAGIIIAWVFAYILGAYTGLNMTGSLYELGIDGEVLELRNLILPTLTLGMRPLSIIVQLTRSSLLDVLSQDYIRTATAKGLSNYKVITKHALKNALNPVITAISGWFASLLAGAVFVEYIFGWNGIGRMMVKALESYDFPVVMGAVLFIAVFFVVINIIVDIIYGILDPRIRVQ